MSGTPTGTNDNPAPGAPGEPAPAPAPAPAPEPENKLTLTSAQLNERLARGRAALLKELGFESEEQAKKMREDAEKQRQASLTNEQRLQEENARLARELSEAAAARAQAEFDANLVQRCAERRITDVSYARFLVQGVDKSIPVESVLDEALKDGRKKIALGVEDPAPTVVPTPFNTTPTNPNLPPPRPATNGTSGPPNAMTMKPDEFKEYSRKIHGA